MKKNTLIKGVILAGGMGTRLRPLTCITNKHLLPVYDKPMVLYPLETLRRSGITEIMIVSGREHAGDFMNFLGSGTQYGVKLSYAIQETNNGGIADALACAEDFAEGGSLAVILGDNIFLDDFSKPIRAFSGWASIFLKKVTDPRRYGVPVFDKERRIVDIEEKPKNPKSSFAQTGLYLVDKDIFERIRTLKPSKRGELEMTDAINMYVHEGRITYHILKKAWYDTGTVDSLVDAACHIRRRNKSS